MMRGYRGFSRELQRTGSLRALSLQLRTGIAHMLRRLLPARPDDPVARFFAHYAADGVRPPDAKASALALQAQRCLVCGLCSIECARVGGTPRLDPRDAVIAGARLEVDLVRLGLEGAASACGGCDACSRVCPAGIPIERVQQRLAELR